MVLAVPIVGFLLSSVLRAAARTATCRGCHSGDVSEFPEGETRLATFRNPFVMPTDGKTVDTACWVRRVAGDQFQVFAINCAHLGCPVRWFPQSGLFMCPCHGGAYYRDGSRASGPPERGLFEYPYKVENGLSPFRPASCRRRGPRCASLSARETAMRVIRQNRRMVRPPPATRSADSRDRRTSCPAKYGELVLRLR